MAIEAADRKQVPINMCGQMSGSPLYTMLLLGHGAAAVQRHAQRHPRDQERLPQRDDRRSARRSPQRAMTMENARDVKSYLEGGS